MSDHKAKTNTIIDRTIIFALYLIFWVIVKVLLPISSVGLRLFSKVPQIKNNSTKDCLEDTCN